MINYKEIVTKEDFASVSQDKYEFAVKEGLYHANYLRNQYSILFLQDFLDKRALEIATLGKSYYDENKVVKQVIACNIVFPDNEKFIKIFLSKDLTYDKILNYTRVISWLKNTALQAEELDLGDTVTVADKKVDKLCSLVKLHTGISNYNIIVTKINEIAAKYKDLYCSLQEEYEQNQNKKVR